MILTSKNWRIVKSLCLERIAKMTTLTLKMVLSPMTKNLMRRVRNLWRRKSKSFISQIKTTINSSFLRTKTSINPKETLRKKSSILSIRKSRSKTMDLKTTKDSRRTINSTKTKAIRTTSSIKTKTSRKGTNSTTTKNSRNNNFLLYNFMDNLTKVNHNLLYLAHSKIISWEN